MFFDLTKFLYPTHMIYCSNVLAFILLITSNTFFNCVPKNEQANQEAHLGRICHYWKPIVSVKTSKDDYPYFRKALCLVALVQVSSCAVERVFRSYFR
jgi:hypothetical protein